MPRKAKYSSDELGKAILTSHTWADVCRKIGLKPMTGSQSYIKKRAIHYRIDFSHFKGNKCELGIRKLWLRTPISEYLENRVQITSHRLKLKLIDEGLKQEVCELCGITEWREEPVVFELDHKNGDHHDNRLHNLQIVCPNCHALETRKRKKAYIHLVQKIRP